MIMRELVDHLYLIRGNKFDDASDEGRAVLFRDIGTIHPSLKSIMVRAMVYDYVHTRSYFYTWCLGEDSKFYSGPQVIRMNFLEEVFS